MFSIAMPDRHAARTATLRAATAVLLVLLLALVGCGQQGPAKTDAAKTVAADPVVQVQPAPIDSSAQQPELDKAVSAAASSEPEKSSTPLPKPAQKLSGIAAVERATAAGKHLLLLFYRNDDDSTRAMKKVFAAAAAKFAKRANSVTINVTDAAEREIVTKYQVDRAPMPLVLVVAPGGAVTGGFPGKVAEEQLSGAFVSPGLANSLKALQDGKLVLLCVQNASTKSNDAAMQGVNAFITDTRFAKSTEVVSLDPADEAESKFLKQLQIDPKSNEAVTALMAPPGSVVAKYKGATDKDVMIAALAAKQAGGGGG
jgi:predicted small lipoprotein YifL